MATDLRGHTVPANTGHPARSDLLNLGLSMRDPIPVPNTTARAALIVSLAGATPAIVPSTANPIFTFRADALAGYQNEYTTDGTNWVALSTGSCYALVQRPTTALSIATGTFVPITAWDQVWVSGLGYASGVFTVQLAGRYRISARASMSAVTTGARVISCQINADAYRIYADYPANTVAGYLGVDEMVELAVGDTIEMFLFQSSGATQPINMTVYPRMSIQYLGA